MFHNPEHDAKFLDFFGRYVAAKEAANLLQERLVKAKEDANILQERALGLQERAVVYQESMLEITKTQSKVSNNFIGTVTKDLKKKLNPEPKPGDCSFCQKDGAGEKNGPQHQNWCTRYIG